jgi:hypothetical protein
MPVSELAGALIRTFEPISLDRVIIVCDFKWYYAVP